MARVKSERVSLEQALRIAVEETIEKHLSRLSKGRPLGEELKEVRGAVARIERRLAGLDTRIGGRRRTGVRTGSPGRPPLHTGCKVEGCTNEHYALGLCSKHYQQERRGHPPVRKASARKKARKSRS
jgi:hypothetical protein